MLTEEEKFSQESGTTNTECPEILGRLNHTTPTAEDFTRPRGTLCGERVNKNKNIAGVTTLQLSAPGVCLWKTAFHLTTARVWSGPDFKAVLLNRNL